jgi:murein L,D-transpeptidase YcbB/YkuD
VLKPGDSAAADRLAAVRERLRLEGLVTTRARGTGGPRGTYDAELAGAVAGFQARHGIVVDSILGGETLTSLNVPARERLGQIAANLERYRWLPRDLGSTYILVNVPAFRLQAFRDGKEALTMKVIVGAEYQDRATPVFSDSMQYVVFRPYWNVTDRIAAEEYWPKVEQDPSWLERNGYEVVTSEGKQRIRQRPGTQNALGLVKFMFPNDFAIYLHDTPNDELFDEDIRAFSHGCIRLERPGELAQFVLGWPADSVRGAMEGEKDEFRVDLPERMPVYILYFTTYLKEGELYFGNDLYNRDDALVKAMASGAVPSPAGTASLARLRKLVG